MRGLELPLELAHWKWRLLINRKNGTCFLKSGLSQGRPTGSSKAVLLAALLSDSVLPLSRHGGQNTESSWRRFLVAQAQAWLLLCHISSAGPQSHGQRKCRGDRHVCPGGEGFVNTGRLSACSRAWALTSRKPGF